MSGRRTRADRCFLSLGRVCSGKMLKGASLISGKLAQASEKYVERTVPLAEPVKVSDRTKANLRVVKLVSALGPAFQCSG